MFYRLRQTNVGGYFEEVPPIAACMFIEVDNETEAIKRAEELGCYWEGVKNKVDCECCGDRWTPEFTEASPVIDDEKILPTIEAIAQQESDEYGVSTSVIFKNDEVRVFLPDEDECKYTNLDLCKSKKHATEVDEIPKDKRPVLKLKKGHILVKDLTDGQGGELVSSEPSLNGQAIFKKGKEIFVFHNTDFRKVPDASFRYWSDVSVKINN